MIASNIEGPIPSSDFMIPAFPSLEYSLDMLGDIPQQPMESFAPAPTAPVDFVTDLFQLPSITNLTAEPQTSNALPDNNPDVSGSSSGSQPSSPPKDSRPSQSQRQTSGRWNNRQRGPVSESRKLEVNREAQRRFRMRQKARSRSIETQLAEATAEVRELKVKQGQLEARNQLLEKVALLNKGSGTQPAHSLLWKGDPAYNQQAQMKEGQGLTLTLTLWDQDCVVTVDELSKLPLPKLCKLYTAFVQKLAVCLLDVDRNPASPMTGHIDAWAAEATCCAVAVALYNPEMFKTLGAARLDLGQVLPDKMTDQCYKELLPRKQFSEDQVRDVLHIRRLYYGKLGQLYRERKELRSQVPLARSAGDAAAVEGQSAAENYTALSQLAEQLRINAAEEYSVFLQSFCALWRGVQTSKQRAIGMVHSYPFVPHKDKVMNALAEMHNEPSVETLLNNTSKSDLDHSVDWQKVTNYLQTVNMSNMHMHVPLLPAQ